MIDIHTAPDENATGFQRFQIRRRIGAGGMGVVFEALDTESDRIVALKTLRQTEPSTVFRFKREFRALADLHHRNLVALHELFSTGGQWYFTMELVDGVGFLDWVRPADGSRISAQTAATAPPSRETLDVSDTARPSPRRGTLDEGRLREALIQLARGLMFLHDAGKLHRDIKPSNILVEGDGRVVLCDFGLVLDVTTGEGTPTSPSFTVGTAEYMSPEQSRGARLSAASDWYAVGVVLYRALCGRLPFDGSVDSILARKRALDPLPPSAVSDVEVPSDLSDLAMELLDRDPQARPTGAEVLARLGATRVSRRMAAASAPPFVGRADELATLRSAYEAVCRGSAAIVFLHGSSGIGKTALAGRFLDEIRGEAAVLSGRCYERESVPYKAFDAVVDALSDRLMNLAETEARALVPADTGTLAYLFPTLRRVDAVLESTLQMADVSDRQESRRRAFAALRELLRRIAETSPVAIHIDDLQWGDADSIALLLELVRPPDPPPILIVIAYRSEDAATSSILSHVKRIESWASPDLRVGEIRLDPLPSLDARALAQLLGTDGEAADTIARESSGSPLFVSELVRYCLSRGSGERETLDLDAALRRRLDRLSAESRALLSSIAVAGRPLALALAGEASRLPLRDAHEAIAQLRREQLVRGRGGRQGDAVEVYHDRLREAIVNHLGVDENMRIHRQLALTLERADHADAELLFEHWMAAGDRTHAARHALRAADQAADSLAFDRAARLFRVALELGGTRDGGASVRIRLAAALAAAGRGREAADAYLDASAHGDAIVRRTCLTDAARLYLLTGEIARGLEVLRGLLADAGAALPRTVPGALLSILWFRLKLGLRGLAWRERPSAAIDADDLARLDVLIAGAEGLGMVDNIRGFELTSRALHRALVVGDRGRLARIFAVEACMAAAPNARGVVRARRIVAELDRMARSSGDHGDRVRAIMANGIVTYLSGRFAAVAPFLADADRLYLTLPGEHTLELNMLRLFRLFALRHSGRLLELRRVHDGYLADADRRGDLYLGTSIRRGNNIVWLIAGQPERAREELERTSWTPSTDAYHLQHAYLAGARAELAFYDGTSLQLLEDMPTHYRQLDVARSLLSRVQLIRCDARWMWGRGALLATRSDRRAPAWLLREAKRSARALAREDCAYAGVWSLLLRARLRALAGDVDAAAEIWRGAIAAAEAIDMPHHAAAARRRLGALLGGDAGAALVTTGDAWMAGEGIADAERMTDLYAP